MGIMKIVKEGADLTHPRVSYSWMIGAVVAVGLIALALYAYTVVKANTIDKIAPKAGSTITAGTTAGMSAVAGAWDY